MAGVTFEIDPLVIGDNVSYVLIDYSDDPPRRVGSRVENRTVTVRLRVPRARLRQWNSVLFLRDLQSQVAKLACGGGTLRKTTLAGDAVLFDVLHARMDGTAVEPALTFECAPFARQELR